MIPTDLPDDTALLDLIDRRDPVSVSVLVPSSPVPAEHGVARTALRAAADQVSQLLDARDTPAPARDAVVDGIRSLADDEELWRHQGRGLLVLATPDDSRVHRLPFAVDTSVHVGERFDVTPLLRARGYDVQAYVLQLARDFVRFTHVRRGRVQTLPLQLPDDHGLMLVHAENAGQADRGRATGADGERTERERYAKAVQDEVVRIAPDDVPLILAATDELAPAYRAQNTHPALLAEGIGAHPQSLDDDTMTDAVADILARERAADVSAWKERFGTLRAEGLATSRLAEVAAAAAAAAIEELRIDQDAERSGEIDTYGRVQPSDDGTLLIDLAAAVLRSGGRVIAVPRDELTDGSPVAAELRFPVPVPR